MFVRCLRVLYSFFFISSFLVQCLSVEDLKGTITYDDDVKLHVNQ